MKNRMIIQKGGFIWLDVTDKAYTIFDTDLFDLYRLYDDGTESLILTEHNISDALYHKNRIAIEVGNYNEQ